MELLAFLAGGGGARAELITKIGRPSFVSGRVGMVVLR